MSLPDQLYLCQTRLELDSKSSVPVYRSTGRGIQIEVQITELCLIAVARAYRHNIMASATVTRHGDFSAELKKLRDQLEMDLRENYLTWQDEHQHFEKLLNS